VCSSLNVTAISQQTTSSYQLTKRPLSANKALGIS